MECGFILKRVRDMTRTYNQMRGKDTYSGQSSVTWAVWLNGSLVIYEINGSGSSPVAVT